MFHSAGAAFNMTKKQAFQTTSDKETTDNYIIFLSVFSERRLCNFIKLHIISIESKLFIILK
jgi:hypothetical protein